MTYRYAACAAWLAICLDKYQSGGHPESPLWIDEAKAAYGWAQKQQQNNDGDVNRARMQAAAALYRYTEQGNYQDDFKTCRENDDRWKSKLWFNLSPWHYAATLFALIPENHPYLDTELRQSCIDDIVSQATLETVETANDRGFRYGMDRDILFMLGTFSTPRTYLAAVAYELTGEEKFLHACYTTCDYCLGGNQLNMVKVTGLGERYERQCFHPDSWYLYDYDSKVYTNPVMPGYVIYEMHRNGDWMAGKGWSWVGDENFSRSTAAPDISKFPDAEARFSNRNSVAGSEFTIHQTQILALFAYGYLCGNHRGSYSANKRPTVALDLADNQVVRRDSTLLLSATTTANVRRVEYYYDWHFIGESSDRANRFAFEWDLSRYKISQGNRFITAKAYDDRGVESRPSDVGDAVLVIQPATAVTGSEDHSTF